MFNTVKIRLQTRIKDVRKLNSKALLEHDGTQKIVREPLLEDRRDSTMSLTIFISRNLKIYQ